MKRLLAGAILIFGSASGMLAQGLGNVGSGLQSVASNAYFPASESQLTAVPAIRNAGDFLAPEWSAASGARLPIEESSAAMLGVPVPVPSPALAADPDPSPDPKFLYGGRDDYRWQLGLGISFERFQSSIFNASAVGFNTSIAYYLNNWLGVEGNVMTAFAPKIFDREHIKLLNFAGGPRIAWRQRRWEPWAHGLVGLAHEQPQTADNSRNAFAVQAGVGVDFRLNPRLSFRAQGDWLYTKFFSQSQNNFVAVAGAVIHF